MSYPRDPRRPAWQTDAIALFRRVVVARAGRHRAHEATALLARLLRGTA